MYRELNINIRYVLFLTNDTIPSDRWRFVRKGYRKNDFDLKFQGQNYKIKQIISVS